MSDFAGNIARSRLAHQLIDTLPANPRALTAQEAQILASEAYLYRHLAAHFHAKSRGQNPPPYLAREAALRPDEPCPACGQNVHVGLPESPPTTESAT